MKETVDTSPKNEHMLPLKLTINSLLHLTRHLSSLSEEARIKLLQIEGVTEDQLTQLLATTGSKFHTKINDPYQLGDLCLSLINEDEIVWKKGSELTPLFSDQAYGITQEFKTQLGLTETEFLGTSSVIEIPDNLRDKVVQEPRGKGEKGDEIFVNVIYDLPVEMTDNLIVSVAKRDGFIELLSAYTGMITPPFPGRFLQSDKELKISKEFWSGHAFLK